MTNDRTEAIDLTNFSDPEQPVPTAAASPRRHRRRLAAAVAAALVAVGVGTTLGLASGSEPSASGADRSKLAPVSTLAPSADPAPEAPAADETDDASPDGGQPGEPGHIVVDTTYHGLTKNDFTGSFQITNDGGSDVEWSWSGHHSVAMSPSSGVLAPGESVVVDFQVTWQQLKNGAFIFTSWVTTDDQSIMLTIAGTRDIVVNPGVELPKPQLQPLQDD